MTWTRSDTIATCGVVIALVALVYPIAKDVHNQATRPTASITSPAAGGGYSDPSIETDRAPGRQIIGEHVQILGTADHIPIDQDLWVVLRPEAEGTWQPVARALLLDDGTWRIREEDVTLHAVGKYGLFVYLTSSQSSGELQYWVSQQKDKPVADRMPSLPAGMTLLASETIFRVA
jgi:hypothetical protein